MNVQQAQAFAAIAASKSPAEIEAFHLALMADQDAIARYDWMKANLDTTPKPERQELYKKLDAERAKYPATAVLEDPIFGRAYAALRAKIGLFRGVKWDRNGKLRLSDEVRRENIAMARAHIEEILGPNPDLSKDYGPKVKNLLDAIQYHEDVLSGKIKTEGSIWDVIVPKKEG